RVFFFFQAEDGIRDPLVTGVQTCALPILLVTTTIIYVRANTFRQPADLSDQDCARRRPSIRRTTTTNPFRQRGQRNSGPAGMRRSEERRVGKECRRGWWHARGRCEGMMQM